MFSVKYCTYHIANISCRIFTIKGNKTIPENHQLHTAAINKALVKRHLAAHLL